MKTLRCAAVLLVLLLALAAIMPSALAEAAQVELGARITLENAPAEAEQEFILRLTANEAGCPMPKGQTGGSCELRITGAGSVAFPPITFSQPGVYHYTIDQLSGESSDWSYDARSYIVTVSIFNSDTGFDVEVALRESGKEGKADEAIFCNIYKKPDAKPTPKPSAKPDDKGSITATGENDGWLYCLGGAALLLVAAVVIICLLRRRDEEQYEEPIQELSNDGQ